MRKSKWKICLIAIVTFLLGGLIGVVIAQQTNRFDAKGSNRGSAMSVEEEAVLEANLWEGRPSGSVAFDDQQGVIDEQQEIIDEQRGVIEQQQGVIDDQQQTIEQQQSSLEHLQEQFEEAFGSDSENEDTQGGETLPGKEYEAYGFVNVGDVVPGVMLEIRYYSTYNFVGERIRGYEAPLALLTKEAAEALKKVSAALEEQGYGILIYDAYRPKQAVEHFVEWAKDLDATKMKSYFYPDVNKQDLFSLGYISSKSRHSSGSTVDLTLYELATGLEVDMGGSFDFFGEISHPEYGNLTDEQKENRELLRQVMTENGFQGINTEWWHYTLKEEPYPGMVFDFVIR